MNGLWRRRAASVLLLLAALLAAGGLGFAAPAAQGQLGGARFLAWWQDEKLCGELGISAELRRELAPKLDNLQTSYQLEQTRLNDARAKQGAMLADPKVGREQLLAYNRAEVAAVSERMQALNFEARLLVRGRLSAAQLEKIVASHPRFLIARWFRMSVVPVREGRVMVDDE